MIERNTTIPKKASQIFSTYADNQTAVDIRVLQGERPMAKDNKLIGNFRLDGINPAPRGLPQIEVTFDIDANGILNVSAKDKSTGKEQKITITNSSGLSKDEVERLRKEAELHAAEDANIKETAEARNELDNMAYGIEKQIKENGSKIPAQIKGELEEGVKKAQELLKDNSATKEALKSETQKLTNLLEQSAKYFQEAAQSSASAGAQQAQLVLALDLQTGGRGIAGDPLTLREQAVHQPQDLHQFLRAAHQCVAVGQKDPLYPAVDPPRQLEVLPDLRHRAHGKMLVVVHVAEGAAVVAAPVGHLHDEAVRLAGRPIDLTFVAHGITLLCGYYDTVFAV